MEKEKSILLKTRVLIFKYGIKPLTMDEIAAQLGISKKTLYLYFENKADLVRKIVIFTIDEQIQLICNPAEKKQNPIEELMMIYHINSVLASAMKTSLLFELQKFYPEAYAILETHRNDFIYNSIYANLEEGISKKLYRDDMDIQIIAKIYISRIYEIFNTDLFPPSVFPTSKVLKEMFIYHIRGIASAKGLEMLAKLKIDI